jgi:hypothetical protein
MENNIYTTQHHVVALVVSVVPLVAIQLIRPTKNMPLRERSIAAYLLVFV